MKLDYYHDETGEPRARGRGRYARLASFLESDVQGSRTLLRRIVKAIEEVVREARERARPSPETALGSPPGTPPAR